MSWSIEVEGNRDEVTAATDTTANMPDSVKMFVENATAYYTDETQLKFASHGHAEEGLIKNCVISLEAKVAPQATQPIADTDPAKPTQLPADQPQPKKK